MIHLKDIPAKIFGRLVLLNAEIDRESQLIVVRVKRQKKHYELPLGLILSITYERGLRAEVAEKKAQKAAARKAKKHGTR